MRLAMNTLIKAVILSAVACVIAAGVNLARSDGLPWLASQAYQIYKDCPMMTKEASPVGIEQWPTELADLIVIDARKADAFAAGHLPGARSVPYHPLRSPAAALLAELKAAGPNRVLVYGDTEIDSGRLLAAEFAEAGCLGVRYLSGGFEAWRAAGHPVETGGGA